jgi:WD40 repeat protein
MSRSVLRFIAILSIVALQLTAFAQATPTPGPITAASAAQVQFSADIPVKGIINDLAFSPDGSLLLTAGQDTSVRVWSLEDGEQVAEAYEHFSYVKGAAFTESLMATTSWDQSLIFWSLAENGELTPESTIGGFGAVVEQLAVSPDGSRVAFGVGDGRVRIADAATGAVQYELAVGSLRVTALAYSPDGAQIAAAGGFPASGALIWDVATGTQTTEIAHPGVVTALAYSPDSMVLAVGGEDGVVTLWQDGNQIASLELEDWVTDLAFTPDGAILAATRQDGIMTLWDVTDPAAPDMAVALVAADGAINALAVSPDGAQIATASEDGGIRLWQVK